MKSAIRFILIHIFSLSCLLSYNASANEHHSIIPRNILFGNPDKSQVTFSNDGKYIAYLAPKNGVLNVWIAPSNDPLNAKAITDDTMRGIAGYFWAYDNKHVLYAKDDKGDENYRAYSYDIVSGKTKLLTPTKGVKAVISGVSHKFPNEVLVSLNERDKKYFDIYKINLLNGKKKLVMENHKFTGFVTDHDLNVRFAQLTSDDGSEEYFELKDKKWAPFMKVSHEDAGNTGLVGFDKTNQNLYLLDSRGRNTSALKIMNLKTGTSKILAESKKADVSVFTYHPSKNNIQAVEIYYDKASYKVLDKSIKADIKYLQNLSNGELIINSRTLDDKTWLVAYQGDSGPVKYYKYNRETKRADYLFSNRKDLEAYTSSMSHMHPVIIKARDGLDLVSYITFPKTYSGQKKHLKPVPMVLYVHGGPWHRDTWGFNPVHQWLTNRGYAVLSVNFRGSTGFGKDFLNAGNREWARKMHTDLLDAVNWAIDSKIADPKKIAIMGGSYGGYATLVGLSMTPDIFACGIDIVGPSNILTLIKSVPPYWEPILNDLKKRIGPWDTKEEIEALNQASPLTFAGNINKPLFIAQGANDPRVKQAESDQIVHSMNDKKIPVIYALYPDEGHGFGKAANRLSYYALSEQFLAKVLGGKAEHIGNDLSEANLLLNGKKVNNKTAEEIIDKAIVK